MFSGEELMRVARAVTGPATMAAMWLLSCGGEQSGSSRHGADDGGQSGGATSDGGSSGSTGGAASGSGGAASGDDAGSGGFIGGGGASGSGGALGAGGIPATGGVPPTGGTSGAGGGQSTGGESGYSDVPVAPSPGECEQTLALHARADATNAPFSVATGETVQCFGFQVPFSGAVQGLQFKPSVDNTSVIHDMRLYATTVTQTDGANSACLGLLPDGVVPLALWAPGAGEVNLPAHVGLDLGPGTFVLQVHYVNFGGAVLDSSGFDVCATSTLRPETATVSWLGTELISIPPQSVAQVTGTCAPTSAAPIHVLSSTPFMNRYGTHLSSTVHHADGSQAPVLDVVFDANYLWSYDTPLILQPGESITTMCEYTNSTSNFIGFGTGSSSELCYDFVVAYPAAALRAGSGMQPGACTN